MTAAVRRRLVLSAAACVGLLAAACAHRLPVPGAPVGRFAGTSSPTSTGTPTPRATSTALPDPRRWDPPSTVLIADQGNHRIVEVDANGRVVWQYGATGVPGCGKGQLHHPSDAWRVSGRRTLISDFFNHRVIEVDAEGNILWQYGRCSAEGGAGAGELRHPASAQPLPDGNVLITDMLNHRVIEVSRDGRLVWQFGKTGKLGVRKDRLNAPSSSYRLDDGTTLIADEWNDRIVAVDRAGVIVWEMGGLDPKAGRIRINIPSHAVRDGDETVICDFFNHRVIRVDRDAKILWQVGRTGVPGSGFGYLSSPAMAQSAGTNRVLVADRDNDRVIVMSRSGWLLWKADLALSGPTSARFTGGR